LHRLELAQRALRLIGELGVRVGHVPERAPGASELLLDVLGPRTGAMQLEQHHELTLERLRCRVVPEQESTRADLFAQDSRPRRRRIARLALLAE
jgi:hypothetical protein